MKLRSILLAVLLLAGPLGASSVTAVAVTGTAAGLSPVAEVKIGASIEAMGGRVRYQGLKDTSWKALKLGHLLLVGSKVKTGAFGHLRFRTPEGVVVSLGPNTEMQIATLAPNQTKRTGLKLAAGILRAIFSGRHSSDLDIYNDNAVAAVKGTDLQVEGGDGNADLKVKVFSSEHSGVVLSAWKGFTERLIRPGEAGELSLAGLTFRALTATDMKEANAFEGMPGIQSVPTPPPGPPPAGTPLQRLREAVAATVTDKKVADALVAKALDSGMSGALLERVLAEAGKGDSAFSTLAKEQGLDAGLQDLMKDLPPAGAPATEEHHGDAHGGGGGQGKLLQEAQQALDEIRQDLVKQASQDAQLKKTDLLDGTSYIDRQGYRVVVAHAVHQPDAATVELYQYSQRADGANAGLSVFAHAVTFNQALPQDWTTIYKRSLNDPANLLGGLPNYYRTSEFILAASPGDVCDICIAHTYTAPVLVGPLFQQGHSDFYRVANVLVGSASYGAAGGWLSGDVITVTPSQTADKAWQLDYFNTTKAQAMFTAKVWLLDGSGGTLSSGSFGLGITHLGGFGPAASDKAYELEFTAPGFGGKDVDVLVPVPDFELALP